MINLHIENFKCFKAVDVPLGPLTVVTGSNGLGKSTIIQSLLLLRQTGDALRNASMLGLSSGDNARHSIHLNGPYELALGNTQTLTNSELDSDAITLGLSDGKATVSASYAASSTRANTTIECTSDDNAFTRASSGFNVLAPEFHYLIAERVGPRELYNAVDQEFVTTGFRGEATAHAISQSETRQVHSELQIGEPPSSLFKVQLERWMRTLIPSVQLTPFPYPEVNKVRMGIAKEGNTTPPLLPANTGFGISYSLPIIVSGLLASPGSAFIVENPEAHLHPSAQSAVGYFLACVAMTGVQVVIETHSEHVVNGVRLAVLDERVNAKDVQVLFLGPGASTEPTILPISVSRSGELDSWPVGFFDQQSSDLRRMFMKRRAVGGPENSDK